MKKIITISALSVCSAIMFTSMDINSDNGKAGKTGSPGENYCTECHSSYTLNSGTGSITITSTPAFTNGEYVPGQLYTMNVTVARTGSSVFGLDVECLNSSNANAGTLAITVSSETHTLNYSGKKNVTHQYNGGLTSNTKTFSFHWTAPLSGNATFYATGVAGNHNGGESGDYVYSTTLALTPASSTSIENKAFEGISFSLYPNPVASNLNIEYTLDKPSKVICKLMNINGAVATELLNEWQTAGVKKNDLQLPESLAKGNYFIQMSINGEISIKKIIVQ
jgi:hypothetical protein